MIEFEARRSLFPVLASVLTFIVALGGTRDGLTQATQTAPALLVEGTFYPRLIRVAHGPAGTNGRVLASTNGVIFESTDEGATFRKISTVPVIAGSRHVCCSTLYEVPRDVGSVKAGTLLSAGTYAAGLDGKAVPDMEGTAFTGSEPAVEVYASTDRGRTWTYLSTPVHGGPVLPSAKPVTQRGLWEPEFEMAADGALVMFVSDETDACCSQKLIRIRTRDGANWVDKSDVIAMPLLPGSRPGMIVSTPLPNGTFFMSYEICGANFHCDVYTRTSTDGWNFGAPADLGRRATTATGEYFRHSPGNTFAAGQVLLIGQMLYEGADKVSPQNGRVYFSNASLDGRGVWTSHAVPVPVPKAYDNYCPNYSSALLPDVSGKRVLELASDYDAQHRCVTFYGSGALTPR